MPGADLLCLADTPQKVKSAKKVGFDQFAFRGALRVMPKAEVIPSAYRAKHSDLCMQRRLLTLHPIDMQPQHAPTSQYLS